MTPEIADVVITEFLKSLGQTLDQAGQIAKAAETAAEGDNARQAIEIILDLEPLIFDANTLLNGACLLNLQFDRSTD